MKNINGKSGITLIALIITIIVLIIIAGIAITTLSGQNGVINRATEARTSNVISSYNEQVKLAFMAVSTTINSKRLSDKSYIATTQNNIQELANEVAKDVGVDFAIKAGSSEINKISTNGFTVIYYLDVPGDTSTDGYGYIGIWYTDNSLRSTMNRDEAINKYKLVDIANNKSVNQAVLVSVIRVENYNCDLSEFGLTSTSDSDGAIETVGDIKKEEFEETTMNGKLGFTQEESETVKNQKEQALATMASKNGNPISYNNLNNSFLKSLTNNNASLVEGIIRSKGIPKDSNVVVKAINSGNSTVYMWYEDKNLCWWSLDNSPKLPTSCQSLFNGFNNLKTIEGLKQWDDSGVTNTRQMFYNCSNLESLEGLENWKLANDTNAFEMFTGCTKINSLKPLSKWDLSSMEDMTHTFMRCSSIETLEGIEKWDVSKVKKMQTLFGACSKLTDITALSEWKNKVTKVEDMAGMFQDDAKIETLTGLENWQTSSLTSTKQMFSQCYALIDISALENWNMSKNKDMERMFYRCTKITSIDSLSGWATTSLQNLANTFAQTNITNLDALSGWNVSNVTNFSSTFDGCQSITSISGVSGWNVSKATTMNAMFYNNKKVTNANSISGWNVSQNATYNNMFKIPYGSMNNLPEFKINGIAGTWNSSEGTWTPPTQ